MWKISNIVLFTQEEERTYLCFNISYSW